MCLIFLAFSALLVLVKNNSDIFLRKSLHSERIFSCFGMCVQTHKPESLQLLRRDAPRKRSTEGSEGVSEAELSSADLRIGTLVTFQT